MVVLKPAKCQPCVLNFKPCALQTLRAAGDKGGGHHAIKQAKQIRFDAVEKEIDVAPFDDIARQGWPANNDADHDPNFPVCVNKGQTPLPGHGLLDS